MRTPRRREEAQACPVASALAANGTLLRVLVHIPTAQQLVTLARVSCLNKAAHRVSQLVWRELCLARWPSSAALVSVCQPRAWRALALAGSVGQLPCLAALQPRTEPGNVLWSSEDLLPFFERGQPMLLLEVFVRDVVCFSARLSANQDDNVLRFSADPGLVDGIIANDDEPAEDFAELHQQLHLRGNNTLQPFPQRLLLLHCQAKNLLDEAVCLINDDLDVWNGGEVEERLALSGAQTAITAQLCIMKADGAVAVLHLSDVTQDRHVHGHSCHDSAFVHDDDAYWQEQPSGMLRWARTFGGSAVGELQGNPGFDVCLNVYCLSEAIDEAEAEEAEAATLNVILTGNAGGSLPAEHTSTPASSCSSKSESDVSAGEDAVREVATDRREHLERLRDALRANDAERAVLTRQLTEYMEGRSGGPGCKRNDLHLEYLAKADVVPSPRVSDSSQHTQTTASESSDCPDGGIEPTALMRLAFASLSLGWIPAGDVGAELLCSRRKKWVARHAPHDLVDDEREMSDGEEEAVQNAEAAHFWAQLDARMPWL